MKPPPYVLTQHAERAMRHRGITSSDIEAALLNPSSKSPVGRDEFQSEAVLPNGKVIVVRSRQERPGAPQMVITAFFR